MRNRFPALLMAAVFMFLSCHPVSALSPLMDAQRRLRWSPRVCERILVSDSFSRLSNVLGFTGYGNNLLNRYKELAVGRHDKRVGELSFLIASHYGIEDVDAQKSRFFGLVHDFSAVPFRHFAMHGFLGQRVKALDFNFRERTVSMLKENKYPIDPFVEQDILHFDINDTDKLSDECKITLAAESVEGVVEDILLALRFDVIKMHDLSSSTAVCLSLGLDEDKLEMIESFLSLDRLLEKRSGSFDFDSLVLDIAYDALFETIAQGPDALVKKAREIKALCRRELISGRIFENPKMNFNKNVSEVNALVSLYYINQLFGEMEKNGLVSDASDMIARQHLESIWSILDFPIANKSNLIGIICFGTFSKLRELVPEEKLRTMERSVVSSFTVISEEELLYYLCMELCVMVEHIVPEAGMRKELTSRAA